jgi:hypothetical protein
VAPSIRSESEVTVLFNVAFDSRFDCYSRSADEFRPSSRSNDSTRMTSAAALNGSTGFQWATPSNMVAASATPYNSSTNNNINSSSNSNSSSIRNYSPPTLSATSATTNSLPVTYNGTKQGPENSTFSRSNTSQGLAANTLPHSTANSTVDTTANRTGPGSNTSSSTKIGIGDSRTTEKYWKQPLSALQNGSTRLNDIVVIHVCDENQSLSRDFCCKRDLLVVHMKYFQKFLGVNDNNNNANGYEDIDISVHCDVEIFEWLMTYIHEPESLAAIDKQIIVSILISSEFLQMESLVESCIQQMSLMLNDIIRLPIDLSCISEKLVNRIAALTTPKVLFDCCLLVPVTKVLRSLFCVALPL